MTATHDSPLRIRYESLKKEQPRMRIRDAAKTLSVSELELLELGLGQDVVRLQGGWAALLQETHQLGYVMALTRNEHAVHERKGVYDNVSFTHDGSMGVAVNPDIDLRFLMWSWQHGYAVHLQTAHRAMFSLQFFDAAGIAVHKIYLTDKSNPAAYQQLLEKYRAADQTTLTTVVPCPAPAKAAQADEALDVEAFQQEWLALQDTHDFYPLLKKYGLPRLQALRLAPAGYAYRTHDHAVVEALEQAASQQVPIMVFVNSSGCIQIHTGPVKNLVRTGTWHNVMDPEFNLHLDLSGIAEVWVVKKPTRDGIVTGLEVFDRQGEHIVYLFGQRKPGLPEREDWRGIIESLSLTLA
jgi:putative hemin transport protein